MSAPWLPVMPSDEWESFEQDGQVHIRQESEKEATISVKASTRPNKTSVIPASTSYSQGEQHISQQQKEEGEQQKEEECLKEAAKRLKKVLGEEETNEDIYCRALAQTLHHLAPPVTVGFYGERGRNQQRLLDMIQDQLQQRNEQSKGGKEEARTLRNLFLLIWHMMFYLPVSSSTKPKSIQYLFVNFNAWEYAGCDHTWAGLVTALLDEIEGKDIVPFSIFRAYGGEFKEMPGTPEKKWVRNPRSRLFVFYVFILFVIFILSVLLLSKILGHHAKDALEYAMIPVSVALCFPIVWATKNVWFTLKRKLQREMSRKDAGAQLGFMHSVKQEVETIIKYLQFMAFRDEREMRVVLKIINLDLCTPNNVVGVLDAMSTLLSDKDAPFISILAADPCILVECIQWSSNACSNGYLYLDRIVTLPFSLPQMSYKAKRQLLKELLTRKRRREEKNGKNVKKPTSSFTTEDIQQVLQYLSSENYSEYIPGNSIQMKRVVNTVLTILSMLRLGFKPRLGKQKDGKEEEVSTKEVIDWVILANFWPCRLSWILQCEEDGRQQSKSEASQVVVKRSQSSGQRGEGKQQEEAGRKERKGLLAFYEEHAGELDRIKYKIRKLLELDQDPELFRIFLRKSHFTVEKAGYFADLLINLDFTLKRQFGFLRHLDGIIRDNKSSSKLPSTEKVVSWRVLKKIPSEQEGNKKGSEVMPSRPKTDTPRDSKGVVGSATSPDLCCGKNKTPIGAKTWKLNIYN